jgi:hypothetical protein
MTLLEHGESMGISLERRSKTRSKGPPSQSPISSLVSVGHHAGGQVAHDGTAMH